MHGGETLERFSQGSVSGGEQERVQPQPVAQLEDVVPTVDQDQRLYLQGLSDYVHGRRDTQAALAYVAYWSPKNSA